MTVMTGRTRWLVAAEIVALLLTIAACGQTPPPSSTNVAPSAPMLINGCEVLWPRELVSGAPARSFRMVGPGTFEWGAGEDAVGVAVGQFPDGDPDGDPESFDLPPNSPQRVQVRGDPAVIIPIGDEGIGQIAIAWRSGDCPYTLWLAPGVTIEEAADFAARF